MGNEKVRFRMKCTNSVGASDPSPPTKWIIVENDQQAPIITCDEKYNKTVIIRARTRLQLVAHIRGKPEPTVTWHKDNIPMIEEDRLVFNEKDQVYSMTMSQPVRDDSGVYKVHAENEHGEEFKNVTIQVVDITKTSMTLLFKPPTDNGGAEITNYIVDRREVGRNVWSKLSTTIEPKV